MLDKKKIISSLIGAGIISAHVVGGSFAASCMGEHLKIKYIKAQYYHLY